MWIWFSVWECYGLEHKQDKLHIQYRVFHIVVPQSDEEIITDVNIV